jgi:hypothetical protein
MSNIDRTAETQSAGGLGTDLLPSAMSGVKISAAFARFFCNSSGQSLICRRRYPELMIDAVYIASRGMACHRSVCYSF